MINNFSFLVCFSADSPVLWLRVDPDMNLLSHVTWEQPDYMWQYQLRYERDIVAQREVIMEKSLCSLNKSVLAFKISFEKVNHFYYLVNVLHSELKEMF